MTMKLIKLKHILLYNCRILDNQSQLCNIVHAHQSLHTYSGRLAFRWRLLWRDKHVDVLVQCYFKLYPATLKCVVAQRETLHLKMIALRKSHQPPYTRRWRPKSHNLENPRRTVDSENLHLVTFCRVINRSIDRN